MLKKNLITHFPIFIFIITYIIISSLIYKDFGVTEDEFPERKASNDLITFIENPSSSNNILSQEYNYRINEGSGHHPLTTKYQRSYQYLQNKLNTTDTFERDHLINLIFSSLFFITIYILFYHYYKSVKYALIAVAFLFFTPRLVGDIPTNNKDVPFAFLYLMGLIAIYFDSKLKINDYLRLIILGIVFGFLQTFRGIGFSIYIIYILYSILYKNDKYINLFYKVISIGLISLTISILFFPWLGSNLISNLPEFLFNTQKFQRWDGEILFNGEILKKDDRPWFYLFTWIGITTPLITLALSGYSLLHIKKFYKNELFMLSFSTLLLNFILYLVLQPVIYNGLRHFLFILPSIVILATIGFIYLYEHGNKTIKFAIIFFGLINSFTILYSYIALHPYQYIYFNELVGGLKGASSKFDLDYWGASYIEAADWIKNNNKIEDAKVKACSQDKAMIYYAEGKYRYYMRGVESPNYVICDSGENFSEKDLNNSYVIHEIERMGVVINTIRQYK